MRQTLATSNMKTTSMEDVLPYDLKPVEELPLAPCYAGLSDSYHTPVARMNQVNPKYVLRNHLAQAAIDSAINGDDSEVAVLMRLLSRPYDEQPAMERYAAAPPDELRHLEISCSS